MKIMIIWKVSNAVFTKFLRSHIQAPRNRAAWEMSHACLHRMLGGVAPVCVWAPAATALKTRGRAQLLPLSRLINPLAHLLMGILNSLSGDEELGPQGCTPVLVLEQGVSVALASSTQIQECEGSDFTKIHTFTGRQVTKGYSMRFKVHNPSLSQLPTAWFWKGVHEKETEELKKEKKKEKKRPSALAVSDSLLPLPSH